MNYKDILWVEDNPNVLEWVEMVDNQFRSQECLAALLDRVTWAFDREMAMQSISDHKYDLIILDADFPDRLDENRRQYIRDWLKAKHEGKNPEFDQLSQFSGEVNVYGIVWNLKEGRLDKIPKPIKAPFAVGDNFAQLYAESLRQLQTPIVVLSSSMAAPDAAFSLKLPFYSKTSRIRQDEIPIMDKHLLKDDPVVDSSFLENWEYGNIDEFIAKYLL